MLRKSLALGLSVVALSTNFNSHANLTSTVVASGMIDLLAQVTNSVVPGAIIGTCDEIAAAKISQLLYAQGNTKLAYVPLLCKLPVKYFLTNFVSKILKKLEIEHFPEIMHFTAGLASIAASTFALVEAQQS